MFLQIHTLTSYPASLLNRDDAGLAKRIPFGNATRLRVSSQCLKRHWRDDLKHQFTDIPDGQRSRSFFTRTVLPRVKEEGVSEAVASKLIEQLADAVINGLNKSGNKKGGNKKDDNKKGGVKEGGDLKQPMLFGLREADYFVQVLVDASRSNDPANALDKRLRDEEDNIKAMGKAAAGLSAVLFGRMVTSDLLARVDAPVHVAHAFTVHASNTEMDYFTVVDDLNRNDETGAAHVNQSELGAGVYYGYVAVDVPLLVSNLTGCKPQDWRQQKSDMTERVLRALMRSIVQQSPGAKKGSTAPYAWADLLFLEAGAAQPRSLANAFLEAVPLKGDVRQQSADRMLAYMGGLDTMYGVNTQRFLATTLSLSSPLQVQPVDDAAQAALKALWA